MYFNSRLMEQLSNIHIFRCHTCCSVGEWVSECYQSLTAHQHQKGHTVPKQVRYSLSTALCESIRYQSQVWTKCPTPAWYPGCATGRLLSAPLLQRWTCNWTSTGLDERDNWDTVVDRSQPYEPGCHLRWVNGIGSSYLYLQILGMYAWYSIPRSFCFIRLYFSANTGDKWCWTKSGFLYSDWWQE